MSELPSIPPGSNVLGVGIDQIEVSRIRDSLDKHGAHFLDKIFTSGEQAYCRDKADPVPHLAARFAAKEAASKAFGTGFGEEFGWLERRPDDADRRIKRVYMTDLGRKIHAQITPIAQAMVESLSKRLPQCLSRVSGEFTGMLRRCGPYNGTEAIISIDSER